MRNKRQGISLIVLVVTIIVIIILAGAVILSLTQNNPIEEANRANREQTSSEVTSALGLYLNKIMAKVQNSVQLSTTTEEDITTNAVKVKIGGVGGQQIYENASGDMKPFATEAAATAAGYTTEVTVTSTKLGFATWPTVNGYKLMVDKNCYVKFVKNP